MPQKPKRHKRAEDWFILKESKERKKFASKIHKTTLQFDSNLIVVYQQWRKYAFTKHGVTEKQLKVLSQLNNQTQRQNAHCIAYNIHLPVQQVNRLLDELWNKNLINIHKQQNKPTEKHPMGVIYKTAVINNFGKDILTDLAVFHKKYWQI